MLLATTNVYVETFKSKLQNVNIIPTILSLRIKLLFFILLLQTKVDNKKLITSKCPYKFGCPYSILFRLIFMYL